jgi:hypothetical protein
MFGNLEIKTRPLRLAYLVNPNDARQVREAIRLSSTLWGGSTFPIIPLYKRIPRTWREELLAATPAKSIILGYLQAFDPDVLIQLADDIPEFVKALGLETVRPEEIWRGIIDPEPHSSVPKFGIGIFEILNDVFEEYFKYKVKYPISVVIPKISSRFPLFWASFFGELPTQVARLVHKHYWEPLDVEAPEIDVNQLSDLWRGNVLFPRRLTQHKLEYRNLPHFGRDASVFFMDISKTEDIVDFWNLRASGRTVMPLPKQFQALAQMNEMVTSFLREHRHPVPNNPSLCFHTPIIRSRNCTMEEMSQYATTLKIERDPADPSNDAFFSLQHWYPRIWDEWARGKDGASPADVYGPEKSIEVSETSERKISFTPTLPSFAEEYAYHDAPRCANEVGFRLYGETEFLAEVFPSSAGEKLTRAIAGEMSLRGEWRIGRYGLVKLVKNQLSERRSIPASEDVFFAWLTDLGWTPKLSTPGLLAKEIHRQLGAYPEVLLQNENVLGLLEHMNGGRVHADGTPVYDNRFVQDRDLAIGEVKNRAGSLYQYMLEKGIFKLGLRMQCPHCLRNSWFPLDNVRDTLGCSRCLNTFPAVGHLHASTWSYKTTGPFSLPNYADGAYAVLLAVRFFDDRKMHTMRTTSVVSFTAEAPSKKHLEADFAALWQESRYGEKNEGVLFGECKTYGKFEKRDFDRMQYIGETFPGAVLVFSTLRKTLTRQEIAGISRVARAGRRYWKPERPINPVLVLTGTELLSYAGPPYCWEESIKNQHKRVSSLLSLCDASQQIYLGLPSWETEWLKNLDKKRQRQKSKQGEAAA